MANNERLKAGLKARQKRLEGSWPKDEDVGYFRPGTEDENFDPFPDEEFLGEFQVEEIDSGGGRRFSTATRATTITRYSVGRKTLASVQTAGSRDHSHHVRRQSGMEYQNLRLYGSEMMGFDLEVWWRRSGIYTRLLGLMVVFLFFIMIIHLLGSIYFIISWLTKPFPKPHVCTTDDCKKAVIWMNESMNRKVQVCDNFYEYICGNYNETRETDAIFEEVLTKPGFKLEFGEESVLARVLRNFKKGDELYNQPIRYYQTCLDEEKRDGIDAFIEKVEYVFGTNDLHKIELSMDEIATNLFRTVGHAYFINFAFYPYPFIQIVEPTESTLQLSYEFDPSNKIYVEKVLRGLLPRLGFPKDNPDHERTVTQMVQGAGEFSGIIYTIYKLVEKLPEEKGQIEGLSFGNCPPFGQHLSYFLVINKFFDKEFYKPVFLNPMTRKYVKALMTCFNSVAAPVSNSKLSFVSMWLVLMFEEFASVMSKDMLDDWGFNEIPNNTFVKGLNNTLQQAVESRCLKGLWQGLGYLPSILYMTSDEFKEIYGDPSAKLYSMQENYKNVFESVRKEYFSIPREEISDHARNLAKAVFNRSLFTHVVMPMVGSRVYTSLDDLGLTDDYLMNKFIARSYTVKKGMDNWVGSTNTFPAMKWWGHGSPGDLKSELLDLRFPMIVSARLKEEKGAAIKGEYETFLNRIPHNYILFPLTILFSPYNDDTLALQEAAETFKAIAAMLALLDDAQSPTKYRSVTWEDLLEITDNKRNSTNYSCWVMLTHEPKRPEDILYLYRQQGVDKNYFTWKSNDKHQSVIATKIAYKYFRDHRKRLEEKGVDWDTPELIQAYHFHQRLPGKEFRNFTEEQLFFMVYTRHTCRASWKKYELGKTMKRRYLLEATLLGILSQMKEFSDIWECSGKSLMNNYGKNRCMNWVPS